MRTFSEAIQKVQTIGLSFGGGCFFENGVAAVGETSPSVTLSTNFSGQ